MKVLGIETSCDETAAAVVESAGQRRLKLLSNVVASSIDQHRLYGGVVPEIAARSHIESINPVIGRALREAGCRWDDIQAIAVTYGPGLGGSLLVGVLSARTLAILHDKPLYPINHVEAHVYSAFITETGKELTQDYRVSPKRPDFPLLALIVSGGHTQLVFFKEHSDYHVLGKTTDDAAGEAFDKVAKMLGLPYPGGPGIEKLAGRGNAEKYNFPKAKTAGKYDFSYSGLKTAVLRTAQKAIGEDYTFPSHQLAQRLSGGQKADIAAGFTQAALELLVDKTVAAEREFQPKSIVVAGGVSASPKLRLLLSERLPDKKLYFPDSKLCTDNAVMIAALGYFKAGSTQPASPELLEIVPNLSM
ncbi:MAG TPA: tRNA (adenosine(37)-N6)-threonylcarbamoyltransferase complex transferase subunit TsaD [Candidatus Saccharimonadales bacterium]|nr:tRNA (adenosine(37)-N6)-threonylcarbamoyltransferase complex transferase subunit TsaD [Candidatus Saccharimonadales bacterium]